MIVPFDLTYPDLVSEDHDYLEFYWNEDGSLSPLVEFGYEDHGEIMEPVFGYGGLLDSDYDDEFWQEFGYEDHGEIMEPVFGYGGWLESDYDGEFWWWDDRDSLQGYKYDEDWDGDYGGLYDYYQEQNDTAKLEIGLQENMQDDASIYHLKPDADVTHLPPNVKNLVGRVAVGRMLINYVAFVFVSVHDNPSVFFAIIVLSCLTLSLVSLVLLSNFRCRCYIKSTTSSKKTGLSEVVPYSQADNDYENCPCV